MNRRKIIIPLPSYGFDPTESAIPWSILSKANVEVSFCTPNGQPAKADTRMLTGEGLGIWKPLLQARADAVKAYQQMSESVSFLNPKTYSEAKEEDYDGILLPGGHDKGVKEYLESKTLQTLVAEFFAEQKPVGAICHGVVLAARSIDPKTRVSVLFNYKTTALLKSQEMAAYNLTRLWLGDYYLTYPGLTVQDEVISSLSSPDHFVSGSAPLLRDDETHLQRGFTVIDRHYVSARWPGDAYSLSTAFLKMLSALRD